MRCALAGWAVRTCSRPWWVEARGAELAAAGRAVRLWGGRHHSKQLLRMCVLTCCPCAVCVPAHPDGGVLYICGVPGTGKTALVMELLRGLRPQALQAGAQVVAINCLQLPTPQHVFSRLWEKLSGQHLGPAR